MSSRLLLVAGAIAALPALSAPALAGGCHAHSAECYERVRTPDVYATVKRPVVVEPGYQTVVSTPPVVGFRPHRVTTTPAHIEFHHKPASYGTYMKRVQVAPARTVWRSSAPLYKTVAETQVVSGGGWRWEKRADAHGRVKLCKVKVPAVTRTVHRRVLVSGGTRIATVVPAEYRWVSARLQLSPAKTVTRYHPAQHQWVNAPMTLKAAEHHVVNHPPVVAYEKQKVLVQRGGYGWQRTGW